MIYIFHGDDIVSSRAKLTTVTSGYDSVTFLHAEKNSPTEIRNSLLSSDLFVEKKCIVIEHILKLKKDDIEFLQNLSLKDSPDIIFWHNTELSKVFLGKFKEARVESFMLPKLFFTFLDSFTPHNLISEIKTLSQMTNVDEMQIFYALVKRVRILLMIKSGGNFEELSKMSPWQYSKLKTQSEKWKVKVLEDVYSELFALETKIKSSGLMLPLKKHLDIMLMSALN